MIDSDIIVALIVAAGGFAGNYLSARKANALLSYRLEQLERKVDKLDASAEIARLRERIVALEERMEGIGK